MSSVILFLDNSFPYKNGKVNIMIVEHKSPSCLEIIAHDISRQVEAPRIYVNNFLLMIKLKNSHETVDKSSSNTTCRSSNVANYIMERIMVSDLTDPKAFDVHLIAVEDHDIIADKTTNRLDIEYREKPFSIIPYDACWDGGESRFATYLKQHTIDYSSLFYIFLPR